MTGSEQVRRFTLCVEREHFSDWHQDTTVVEDGPALEFGDGPLDVVSLSDIQREIAELRAETRGHTSAFVVLEKVERLLGIDLEEGKD